MRLSVLEAFRSGDLDTLLRLALAAAPERRLVDWPSKMTAAERRRAAVAACRSGAPATAVGRPVVVEVATDRRLPHPTEETP